jgi:hypothetical protein
MNTRFRFTSLLVIFLTFYSGATPSALACGRGSCFFPCWDWFECECYPNAYMPTTYADVVITGTNTQIFTPVGTTWWGWPELFNLWGQAPGQGDYDVERDPVAGLEYGNTMGAVMQLGYGSNQATQEQILSGGLAAAMGAPDLETRAPRIPYATAYRGNIWGPVQWKDVRDPDFMGTGYLDLINGRVPGTARQVSRQQAADWGVPASASYNSWSVTTPFFQYGESWSNCENWLAFIIMVVVFVAAVVVTGLVFGPLYAALMGLALFGAAVGVGMVSDGYKTLSGTMCTYGCYMFRTQYTFYMVYDGGGTAMDITLPNTDVAAGLDVDLATGTLGRRHYTGPTRKSHENGDFLRSIRGSLINLGDSRLVPASVSAPVNFHIVPPANADYLPNFPLYGIEVQN